MNTLNQIGLDFYFTREYLKAAVLVSLVSVWVLVALFTYLNFYTRRRYFTIWTGAWLFYALWLTLSFGLHTETSAQVVTMLEYWCVGVSAVFLLWGSQHFLGERVSQSTLGWFIAFLLVWSYFGTYHLSNPLQTQVPFFSMLSIASLITARSFFRYRKRRGFIGATLLSLGFLMWGGFMASYPFLENSDDLVSIALFLSAGIQIFLAVSMIVLVLEEVRHTHHTAVEHIHARKLERDQLQNKVNSTEERYRNLFDHAGEAIVIAHADNFRILELNRAAERLLGISKSDAGRHSLTAFCQIKTSGGPPPYTGGEWFQLICRQRPLNLVRKNGGVIPAEVDGSRVDFDGQPSYQFYLRELTESARLEQQLRQAEKLSALGQMISGVAHELNNPLAVVKGYLELVLTHHDLSAETRADLQKAAQESNRAARLVGNFLSFAREQPAHREQVNFNGLIQRIAELRKFDLMVANIELQLELDPALPETSADPDQVQQILVNLMNNALQAMAEVSHIRRLKIRTKATAEMIRVVVEDNGPGVPSELTGKIFEPFFTTKEVGAGTGLGLSIAHSIMTEHGGKIHYQPVTSGGASFILEFPVSVTSVAKENTESVATNRTETKVSDPIHGNVLVLDDEPAIAEMLGEMLSLIGHKTTICHSPALALAILENQGFDAILSDFRMPGMNGQQFYEATRQRDPDIASRIVFLSGDLVNDSTREFLESTGNPHLSKPFHLSKVKEAISAILEAHRPSIVAASAA